MALNINLLGNDTIAAIATGMTEAGIGIIRISGPEAFCCIEKIFRTRDGRRVQINNWKANTIHYGNIVDDKEAVIDEVLVSIFRAPQSYTTEDSIEINTHGGIYLEQRILQLVLANGARMAEPGEFTKRAFLGGRIDLTRAEAVMDLIASQNEYSRRAAINQLKGSASQRIQDLRDQILYELAFIESALDDPENYDTEGYPEQLRKKCLDLIAALDQMLVNSRSGRILKNGIQTVIYGRPNAGKSSLMNLLLGEDRAIVSEIAGTTRDTLDETVRLVNERGEMLLHLTDTAGIHQTTDPVEKIGIERAQKALDQSALILFLIDRSVSLDAEGLQIIHELVELLRKDPSRRCIVILNKSDLSHLISTMDIQEMFDGVLDLVSILELSMKDDHALEHIKDQIEQMFYSGSLQHSDEVLLTSDREMTEIHRARNALSQVLQSIDLGMTEDFYSSDLMDAYTALGRIIGEAVEDDLVEEIFHKFCLGK